MTSFECGGLYSKPIFLESYDLFCVPCSHVLKVFSSKTGKCIQKLSQHKKRITQIILDLDEDGSASTTNIYSVSEDGNLCYWEYSQEISGFNLKKQISIGKPIYGIEIDKANPTIIYLCVFDNFYNFIKVNIKSSDIKPEELNNYLLQTHNFTQMCSSKHYLFAIGGNNLFIYNLKKKELEKQEHNKQFPFSSLAYNEEIDTVATGDSTGVVTLWFSDGTNSRMHWHSGKVTCLQFNGEGDYLFSGGVEGVIVSWRLPSQKKDKFMYTRSPIHGFIVNSTDDTAIVVGRDNCIRNYEFQKNELKFSIFGVVPPHEPSNENIYFVNEPNSPYFLVTGSNTLIWMNKNDETVKHREYIQFLQAQTSRLSSPITAFVEHIAFSEDGQYFAHVETLNSKQYLKIWSIGQGKKFKISLVTVIESPHSDRITSLRFHPTNNKCCITTSLDGKVKVWTMINEMFKCSSILEYKSLSANSIDFSMDGTLMVISFSSTLTFWDFNTMEVIETFEYPFTLTDAKFIDDDNIAVTSSRFISLFTMSPDMKNVWSMDAGIVESLTTDRKGKFAVLVNRTDIAEFNVANGSSPLVKTTVTDHHVVSIRYMNDGLYFLNKIFEIFSVGKDGSDNKQDIAKEETMQEEPEVSLYDNRWNVKEKVSLQELQKIVTVPFAVESNNATKAWRDLFSAPSHSLISMGNCYKVFMDSYVAKTNNISSNVFETHGEEETSTKSKFASFEQKEEESENENDILPSSELIQFIKNYNKV